MREKTYYTTGEVAALVQCDHKTVLNWVAAGKGPALFRTPRGHRRFPAIELAAWMASRGLPVPDELKPLVTVNASHNEEIRQLVELMTAEQRRALLQQARRILAA